MKLKLLPKFIISLGIVGLVLTIAVSLFSYATSKSYLEDMYADRVMTNINAIAAMLDVDDVKTILSEVEIRLPNTRKCTTFLIS